METAGDGTRGAPQSAESRIRQAVIPPIERLLGQLSQADLRVAVRAELGRQQEDSAAADQVARAGLVDRLRKLEARLTQWEDLYGDGEMPRERFIQRRDEVFPQIEELRAQLAAQPQVVMPNLDQLFAFAENLTVADLDNEAWRQIIQGLVYRVVIEGAEDDGRKAPAEIRAEWKPQFRPLLERVTAE